LKKNRETSENRLKQEGNCSKKTTFFQGKKQNGRKNCNHGKPDTGAERFFGKKSVTVGDHEKATLCRSPNPSPLSQAKPGTESWVFFIL